MNRYWDLAETDRAALTRDEVNAFLTVELMKKGVARVSPVELKTVPEVIVDRKKMYKVGFDGRYSGKEYFDCLFSTVEQAQSFIDLMPQHEGSDYSIGSEWKWSQPVTGYAIEPTELSDHASVLTVKSQLEKREQIKKKNDAAVSAHNAAAKKVSEATKGVWEDWYELGEKKNKATRVIETYAEYTTLCAGNESQAYAFLQKAYDNDEIREAFEWFGKERPQPIEVASL